MTAALEGGEWSAARPGRTLPPGKTRYPFSRRLGGPQGRSGWAENLVLTGIRSRTVQPVAHSLYRLSYRAHLWLLYLRVIHHGLSIFEFFHVMRGVARTEKKYANPTVASAKKRYFILAVPMICLGVAVNPCSNTLLLNDVAALSHKSAHSQKITVFQCTTS